MQLIPAHLKLLLLTGAVAFFSGCASVPSVELDKTAASQMKSIAVLGIHEPVNVVAVNLGGAAGAFGMVGGLVQATTNADHSKQFVEIVRQQKPTLSEGLLAAVEQALKADGFDVMIVRDQKAKVAADGKSDDYSDIHVEADAILSVWFAVTGYISSPFSLHYEPNVLITARLLDAKSKKDIYRKSFCVGYKMMIDNAVMLPADSKYQYGSFEDLMAHANEAMAGLINCHEIAAKQIGQDLKLR